MFHQLFVREVVVNYNWNYSKRVSPGPSHQRHRQQHWKACRLRGVCIETMGSVDNMDYTMWIRTRKDVGRYWWMLCKESRVVPKAKETTFKPADAPQGWQPTSTFGNQLRKRLQERLPDATTLLGFRLQPEASYSLQGSGSFLLELLSACGPSVCEEQMSYSGTSITCSWSYPNSRSCDWSTCARTAPGRSTGSHDLSSPSMNAPFDSRLFMITLRPSTMVFSTWNSQNSFTTLELHDIESCATGPNCRLHQYLRESPHLLNIRAPRTAVMVEVLDVYARVHIIH
ncbi:hypothetical protein BGZ88_007177 [Linnemannia elongata]|nr:hypothetical protein BGZ88_007177 [Linnemannia elongata]